VAAGAVESVDTDELGALVGPGRTPVGSLGVIGAATFEAGATAVGVSRAFAAGALLAAEAIALEGAGRAPVVDALLVIAEVFASEVTVFRRALLVTDEAAVFGTVGAVAVAVKAEVFRCVLLAANDAAVFEAVDRATAAGVLLVAVGAAAVDAVVFAGSALTPAGVSLAPVVVDVFVMAVRLTKRPAIAPRWGARGASVILGTRRLMPTRAAGGGEAGGNSAAGLGVARAAATAGALSLLPLLLVLGSTEGFFAVLEGAP